MSHPNDDIDENKLCEFDKEINIYQSTFTEPDYNENNNQNHINIQSEVNLNDNEYDNNAYTPNYTLEGKYDSYNSNMDNNDIDKLVTNYNIMYTHSPKNKYLDYQRNELNKIKFEYDKKNKSLFEAENFALQIHKENSALMAKIEEYQKNNKDWEYRVGSIKNVLLEVEEKNKSKIIIN